MEFVLYVKVFLNVLLKWIIAFNKNATFEKNAVMPSNFAIADSAIGIQLLTKLKML